MGRDLGCLFKLTQEFGRAEDMGPKQTACPAFEKWWFHQKAQGRGMLKGVQPPPEPSLSTSGFHCDSIRGIRKLTQKTNPQSPTPDLRVSSSKCILEAVI